MLSQAHPRFSARFKVKCADALLSVRRPGTLERLLGQTGIPDMKQLLLMATIVALICPQGFADPPNPMPRRNVHSGAHRESKLLKEFLKDLAKGEGLPSSSSGVSRGDYNGDGFADLAVGIPLEDTPAGTSGSGAVIVIYGSRNGLTSTDSAVPAPQFWSQNSDGISGASESSDRFGTSLAAGEFNGDQYSDLAIGVPGEDITAGGSANTAAGRVVIIYGSPAGLAASGPNVVRASQSFDLLNASPEPPLNLFVVDYVVAAGANLGQSLAWGDFDGDGFGDLAMGAPRMDIKFNVFLTLFPTEEAGGVWVLYGSATGLKFARQQLFLPDNDVFPVGVVDTTRWHYGASLASGDFDFNGADDLAIGAPDQDIYLGPSGRFADRAGAVEVIPGFKTDSTGTGGLGGNSARLCQRTPLDFYFSQNFQTDALANEHFGFALASGDFDLDGASDLAIGVPGQSGLEVRTSLGNYLIGDREAGAVHVVYGVRKDTYQFDNPAVYHFYNTIGRDVDYWDQNRIFGSGNETGDRFGSSLATGHFNLGAAADLAIGVPGEDLPGGADAGQVNILYAGLGGLTNNRTPPQRFGDVSAQAGAQFGSSLSAWDFGKNGVYAGLTDLAVGVPFKDVSGKLDAGAMHIFYGSPDGLALTGEQEWTQDSPGIPGACETSDLFGATGY